MIEKAAAGFLTVLAGVAVVEHTFEFFSAQGLNAVVAGFVTAAAFGTSCVVLWGLAKRVFRFGRNMVNVVEHAVSQPERDKVLQGEIAALREDVAERFKRLEGFLERRASPRDRGP